MLNKGIFILSLDDLSVVQGGQGGSFHAPLSGPTTTITSAPWSSQSVTKIDTNINKQIINQFVGSKPPGMSMVEWRKMNPHLAPYKPMPVRGR